MNTYYVKMLYEREPHETVLNFCKRLVEHDCAYVNVFSMTRFNVRIDLHDYEINYCFDNINTDPHYRYIHHCFRGVTLLYMKKFTFIADRIKLLLLINENIKINASGFIGLAMSTKFDRNTMMFLISLCVLHYKFTRALSLYMKFETNCVKQRIFKNIINIASLIDIDEVENLETNNMFGIIQRSMDNNAHAVELYMCIQCGYNCIESF